MVIYIACPYARKADALAARKQFQAAGLVVNSRWLDFALPPGGTTPSHETLRTEAEHDVEDILACDVLVVLNLEKSEGKAWEQGLAYGLHIPIVAVGEPAHCVFHHLYYYEWVSTVEAAIASVCHLTWRIV